MLRHLRQFRRRLLKWYDAHQRELPWRRPRESNHKLDPYHVLVSEAMCQQTQVATVIPYFRRFIQQWPTVQTLAAADEQDVLRMWQGLGYYSRARNLKSAARKVVSDFAGEIPRTVESLLTLPGVGRYTAGAIASIAFGARAPILDGNVARVLCRIDCVRTDTRQRETNQQLWRRAKEVLPASRCGDFNSALMELGATICTPRSPKCLICPVRGHCEAAAAGLVEQIPLAKQTKPTPLLKRQVFCIRRDDAYLIEQRPAKGRWAGMWQFVTREIDQPIALSTIKLSRRRRLGEVHHALTHRRYHFEVFEANVTRDGHDPSPRVWVKLDGLSRYPLPRPHLKIAEMLQAQKSPSDRT